MELFRKVFPWVVAAFILLGLGYAAGYRANSAGRFVPFGGGNVDRALDSTTGMRCYTDDRLPPMPPAAQVVGGPPVPPAPPVVFSCKDLK